MDFSRKNYILGMQTIQLLETSLRLYWQRKSDICISIRIIPYRIYWFFSFFIYLELQKDLSVVFYQPYTVKHTQAMFNEIGDKFIDIIWN